MEREIAPTHKTHGTMKELNECRDYTTRSSAHGSDYVPLSTPERFSMTQKEAEADVRFFRAYADTVGGDAIIVKRTNIKS